MRYVLMLMIVALLAGSGYLGYQTVLELQAPVVAAPPPITRFQAIAEPPGMPLESRLVLKKTHCRLGPDARLASHVPSSNDSTGFAEIEVNIELRNAGARSMQITVEGCEAHTEPGFLYVPLVSRNRHEMKSAGYSPYQPGEPEERPTLRLLPGQTCVVPLYVLATGSQSGTCTLHVEFRTSIHQPATGELADSFAYVKLTPAAVPLEFQYGDAFNPLIHPNLYGLYHVAVLLIGTLCMLWWQQGWCGEKRRVCRAVACHLRLPASAETIAQLRDQTLALIPCKGWRLRGSLAGFRNGARLWLWFLADRLLVISAAGRVVEVSARELQKVYLVEQSPGAGHALAVESDGNVSTLLLDRLDDMVRIVNVLLKQGIVLKYRDKAA